MLRDILELSGKVSGQVELLEDVFGVSARPDIVARVIRWQLAKRRQGSHATKTISQVSGTTKKPHKQKGTGRARQGSLRSPQFRGGAVIFGPVVRSHEHGLPKQVRKMGLKIALSDKLRHNKLFVVDFSSFTTGKTGEFLGCMEVLNLGLKSAIIIDGERISEILGRSVPNTRTYNYMPQIGSNVYDIVRHEGVILTPDAVRLLGERLK